MTPFADLSSFKIAYQFLSEAIWVCDADLVIHYANPASQRLLGVDTNHLTQCHLPDLLTDPAGAEVLEALFKLARKKGNHRAEVSLSTSGAGEENCQIQIDSCFDDNQTFVCYVVRIAEQPATRPDPQLQQLAYRDELTGLANRTLFNQIFEHEISQSKRQKNRFALLFIDLDKFKRVNDTLGHEAGDYLLCSIAERMQKTLRKSDLIARIGGDEFVIIMGNIRDTETVARVAEKVIRQIQKPVKYGVHLLEVSCSIGISIFPDNGTDPEHLLHHADIAMYRAKQQGGENYYYFSEELNRELQLSRHLEQEIFKGLEQRQFVPYFQPIIDQRDGTLVGIECLARWQHPEQGVISPLQFLPVAKTSGLIQPILTQVLEGAFGHLQRWYQQLGHCVPLSINLTGNQFHQQATFDQLSALLRHYELMPNSLRIEISESTLQEQGDNFIEQLRRVYDAGFSITLDDFGTGYSSLRYLQQLPVEIIKIDRSFVRNLDNNPHDKVIVRAIIQLAQTLGIEAVAEGVENPAQQAFLMENHCHIMQGFLFCEALPADQFTLFLKRESRETVS